MYPDEAELKAMVESALVRVRTVLDTTKNPQWAGDVPHAYADKFLLAEFVAKMAIASTVQCLERIGLGSEKRNEAREWAKTRSVTLRLRAEERCSFLREEKRQVESTETKVRERVSESSGKRDKTTTTDKVITTITEYVWKLEFSYELVLFQGTSEDRAVSIHRRGGSVEMKTAAKAPSPRPQSVVRDPVDCDIGWLLRHVDDGGRTVFAVDRASKDCHTPRRNNEIADAFEAFRALSTFCEGACTYVVRELWSAQRDHGLDLSALEDDTILVPVLPIFEGAEKAESLLPASYASAFLDEQRRALDEKAARLDKVFPNNETAITAASAMLAVTLAHVGKICIAFLGGVDAVEAMLRAQLIAAIGKEIGPDDFAEYMDFHHRKLVKPQYRPLPFSHAIRRPEHYPEGLVGIEIARDHDDGDGMPAPLSTIVASSTASTPMTFPLDAATRVQFHGDRFLHAFLAHQFSDSNPLSLSLVARARQFSSFILLVGRIASADSFEPKFGIILQNKDALAIPLMLESIPSAKEFREAVVSLSPEQQRFAKAFRGMQLESTLFGVCVIQIKPQLEKLLKLPPDALTKEIKLTQELSRLFIEYQIPSDLLSYDGPDEAPAADKLAKVKEYTARMFEMIELSNKREIEEAQQREALRRAEADRTYVPPPPQMMPMPMAPPAPGGMVMRSAPAQASAMLEEASYDDELSMAAPITMPPSEIAETAGSASDSASASASSSSSSSPSAQSAQTGERGAPASSDGTDYTQIPTELDQKLDALDTDGAVRPAILHTEEPWVKTSQKGLLAAPATSQLWEDEQKVEKNKAFDLLDALSRSGTLPIDHASLHVVIAATHAFDKTLLDAVIQDNVNPIEKVERSLAIMSSTIHRVPAMELLADNQRERFLEHSPTLGLPEKDPT